MSAIFITPRTFWLWLIATVMIVGSLSGTIAWQNYKIHDQAKTISLLLEMIR